MYLDHIGQGGKKKKDKSGTKEIRSEDEAYFVAK